jgi:hypothetical protein
MYAHEHNMPTVLTLYVHTTDVSVLVLCIQEALVLVIYLSSNRKMRARS